MNCHLSFDDLLLHELPWLRRLASSLVGFQLADDIVQDTLVAALHERRQGTRWSNPRAWLATVLRNRVRRDRRREARRGELEGSGSSRIRPGEPDLADAMARTDIHRALVEEVTSLPQDQRFVVVLRYFEGLEFGEIAARAGISAEAARSRHRRAIHDLRTRLDRRTGRRAAWCALLEPRQIAPVPPPTVSWWPLAAAFALGGTVALTIAVASPTAQLPTAQRVAAAPGPADSGTPRPTTPRPRAPRVSVSASASASAGASARSFATTSRAPTEDRAAPRTGPDHRRVPGFDAQALRWPAAAATEPGVRLAVTDPGGRTLGDVDFEVLPTSTAGPPRFDHDAATGPLAFHGRTDLSGIALLPWTGDDATGWWIRVRTGNGWAEPGRIAASRPGGTVSCRVGASRR